MAYFCWYRATYGYFTAWKNFCLANWRKLAWFSFIRSVGFTIGQFLIKKLFLDTRDLQMFYKPIIV